MQSTRERNPCEGRGHLRLADPCFSIEFGSIVLPVRVFCPRCSGTVKRLQSPPNWDVQTPESRYWVLFSRCYFLVVIFSLFLHLPQIPQCINTVAAPPFYCLRPPIADCLASTIHRADFGPTSAAPIRRIMFPCLSSNEGQSNLGYTASLDARFYALSYADSRSTTGCPKQSSMALAQAKLLVNPWAVDCRTKKRRSHSQVLLPSRTALPELMAGSRLEGTLAPARSMAACPCLPRLRQDLRLGSIKCKQLTWSFLEPQFCLPSCLVIFVGA